MPIHNLGYRGWTGRLTPVVTRWSVLAHSGIALAWKSPWLRRVMFFAWLPALYFGIVFVLYELYARAWAAGAKLQVTLRQVEQLGLDLPQGLVRRVLEDPVEARADAWSYLMWFFFSSPQAVMMVIITGLIAPPLISKDVRSRAFLLYFSRPITRAEYLVGKASIVWFYVITVTTLPALGLYLTTLLLSPSLDVVLDTWKLAPQILLASAVLMVPTTLLALCFSSLTRDSRFAVFGWFAIWVLGWTTHSILSEQNVHWPLVSLFHTLEKAQAWVFSLEPLAGGVLWSLLVLAALTLIALVTLYRRISSPMRV